MLYEPLLQSIALLQKHSIASAISEKIKQKKKKKKEKKKNRNNLNTEKRITHLFSQIERKSKLQVSQKL